jgi:glycerol-3-phosphate responsive antiterminator
MSTKEIRQALSEWRVSAEAHGMTNTVAHIDVAMREVEAIEKAAQVRADCVEGIKEGDHHAMERLAEEAAREVAAKDLTPS